MLKAVIFDMDGTLLDSVDHHAQAWQDAFRDFGYSFDLQVIRKEIGKGGDQLLPVFLSEEDIEAKGKELEAHRSDLLKRDHLDQIKPFPEVRALFQRLSDDGVRTILASSSKSDELKVYQGIAGIEGLVGGTVSSEDAENSKPEPDIFHAALEKLPGIAAADIVVIGDTPHDANAAGKAGLRTLGVLCGGVDAGTLTQAGCIGLYRDPADLLMHYTDWMDADPGARPAQPAN